MKSLIHRRNPDYGPERLPYVKELPRHQHVSAYATLILEGQFIQRSYAGRLHLQPGDVLINPSLDCHANQMLTNGVTLVRLPWSQEHSWGGVHRSVSIDIVSRLAATDPVEASGLLAEQVTNTPYAATETSDWPDMLVMDLQANPRLEIAEWAESVGLSRGYAWRCFQRSYGVGPAQFRSELNARAALLKIACTKEPLSKAAADFGFSDQAHMTRAIKALTGIPPGRWRSKHLFKTNIA
jgi:AraC-like DNA-binding protein